MTKTERFRSVLIFGGAGFIGSNLAQRLLETSDAKVHIFDNLSRRGVRHNLNSLQKLAGNSGRLQITVADVRDAAMVERAVRETGFVVTVEEGSLMGGFGSAVLEAASEMGLDTSRIRRLGIPDRFVEHADRGELLADLGLDARGIAAACRETVGQVSNLP